MEIKKAFTLIELMITVAIISILAAAAVPRMGGLINKSKESAAKSGLSFLRSALSVYYGDNISYPTDDLDSLVSANKYLDTLPLINLPGTNHPENRHVTLVTGGALVTDSGGWAYINDPQSKEWGTVLVNCTHQDSKGKNWNEQ